MVFNCSSPSCPWHVYFLSNRVDAVSPSETQQLYIIQNSFYTSNRAFKELRCSNMTMSMRSRRNSARWVTQDSTPQPISLTKPVANLTLRLCKRILLVDTQTQLCLYFCAITIISVVTDYFPFPKSYFSDKRNLINQYFVKLGWGWTCGLLGLFIYLTR